MLEKPLWNAQILTVSYGCFFFELKALNWGKEIVSMVNSNEALFKFEYVYLVVNDDGTVCFANMAACTFFNTEESRLNKATVWENYPGKNVKAALDIYCKVVESQEPQYVIDAHAKNNIDFKFQVFPLPKGVSIICKPLAEQEHNITALKNANERFNLLAKATNDIVWDWNLLTDELWWNDNYARCFGYKPTNNTNHINEWVKNVHEEDRVRVKQSIYAMIELGENIWTEEYRYIGESGKVFFIYDRGYVLYDQTGKAVRMIGCMQDISARIEAERAIKESEEKYRNLVEQASDGIMTVDFDGKILSVNTSACGLSQYSEREMLQMNVKDFMAPGENQQLQFERIKNGETVILQRKLLAKDGSFFDVDTTSNILSDGRILVFVRDVGERVRAATQILAEKYFSDTIISGLPGLFYVHNEKGNIFRWNQNLEATTGFSAEEIVNITPLAFYPNSAIDLLRSKVAEVFDQGYADGEIEIVHKNGNAIRFYLKGTKVNVNGEDCVLVIGLDYSKKHEAEQQLKSSLAEIRRLAKHLTQIRETERKRIGREIHDELGQQITAMKLDAAWIQKNINSNDERVTLKLSNMIDLLNGSNKSVRRILNELNPGIIEKYGLLDAMYRLNSQIEEPDSLAIHFTSSHPFIELDDELANCVFRVYQEAITNIIKHAKANEIVVAVELIEHSIHLTVADNGLGFSEQSKKNSSGFGLIGMKERVLASKGTFTLNSSPNNGTEIKVSIPLDKLTI